MGSSAMPFLEFIPWHTLAVIVVSTSLESLRLLVVPLTLAPFPQPDTSPQSFLELPAKLRAIPDNEKWKMQQRCLEVFHSQLRNLNLHVTALTNLFIQRFEDVHLNNRRPSYLPNIFNVPVPYKCFPGYGSPMHCPEALADDVDMNAGGVATLSVGDERHFLNNGLQLAVSSFKVGDTDSALVLWRRWTQFVLGDVSADRTKFIDEWSFLVGVALLNAANAYYDAGRYASFVPWILTHVWCVMSCSS